MIRQLKNGLMVLLAAVSLSSFASDRPTVSQAQVLSVINAPKATSFTLLDVRTAKEYSEGHIAKAKNISHSDLEANLSMLPSDKEQMIVVYCRSGRRAGVAEAILRTAGYKNVWHLDGDMNGWLASELPVVSK